jgi:hypothetical protein
MPTAGKSDRIGAGPNLAEVIDWKEFGKRAPWLSTTEPRQRPHATRACTTFRGLLR